MQHLRRLLLVALLGVGSGGSVVAGQSAVSTTAYEMSALDQKPRIKSRVAAVYPATLKEKGITGEVVVSFVIDPDGKVKDVGVVGATRVDFVDAAVAAVKQWKFRPGWKDGHPVNTRAEVTIPFTLDRR